MFKDYTLHTTWTRALVAPIGGAAVGAALVAGHLAVSIFPTLNFQYPSLWAAFIDFSGAGAILFAFCFFNWGIGLIVFGCPVWVLLHRLGLRAWNSAAIAGFLVATIAGFWTAPEVFSHGQYAPWASLGNSVIYGLIGVASALTIWRIAYRRPDPC